MSSADEHTTSSSEEESDNGSHSSEESNDEAGDEPEYFEYSEDDTKKRHQRGSPHREKKSECRDQSGTAKRTSEDAEKIDRTRRNPSPGPSRSVTPTRDEKKAPPIRNPKKKLHKAPPQQSRTDSRRKPSYDVYSPETRSPTPLVDEIDELSPPEEIYQPPIQHKKKKLQKSQQSRTQDSDGRRNPPETTRRARSVTPTDDEEKAPLPPKQADKKVLEHLFEQKQRSKERPLDILESYSKSLPQHRRSPVYRSTRDQKEKVKRVSTDFLFQDIFTYYPVTQWTCMRCGFYTGHRCKAIRFPDGGMTPTSDSNHRLTTFKDDINSPLICDFCGSLAFHTKCLDYKSDHLEQVGCEIHYKCTYPNCPGAFWHSITSGTTCILIANKKDDRMCSCSCGQIDFLHRHQSI